MKMGAEMAGAEFQETVYHQCTLGLKEPTLFQDTDSKKFGKTCSGEEVEDTCLTIITCITIISRCQSYHYTATPTLWGFP